MGRKKMMSSKSDRCSVIGEKQPRLGGPLKATTAIRQAAYVA
jgi:hypothetical protein